MSYRLIINEHPEVSFITPFDEDVLQYWITQAQTGFIKKHTNRIHNMVYSQDEHIVDELMDKINSKEDFWKYFTLQKLDWQKIDYKDTE